MDFGSMASMSGKSSMRKKQSNSLLHALGKPRQSVTPQTASQSTLFSSPPSASPSTLPIDDFYNTSEYDSISLSSRSTTAALPPGSFVKPGGGRGISASYSVKDRAKDPEGKNGVVFRRPEDVFKVARERILSWSYMMEWYQGDALWFSTVRIPRPAIESILGYKHLELRSRNFYALGISLSSLFDMPAASDFLRAMLKLLEEWESWSEGSGGGKAVKNLFRGQRTARKVTGTMSDFAPADSTESYLLSFNLPFTPDFFQVHTSTCSVIRDIYRKLLGQFLPSPNSMSRSTPKPHQNSFSSLPSLNHPSTIIHTAPREPFINPKSPGANSLSTATFSSQQGHGTMSPTSVVVEQNGGGDALLAFIAGEVPSDRTLVGDGQKLTPQVAELFMKVDTKLKKHFSTLTREADALAKRVADDQLNSLLRSLTPGGKQMQFDSKLGLSNGGPGNPTVTTGAGYSTATLGRLGLSDGDKERDFGTI